MTKIMEIYKCERCGNIVEIVHGAAGELHCCGAPMVQVVENTTDAAIEKHVPVVEKVNGGYKVTVGSVAHPMVDDHYIEWIEFLIDGKRICHRMLKPGDAPEQFFVIDVTDFTVRAYCNKHGLWKA